MTMSIRPPVVFPDSNGNPAADFQVYIGKPKLDPRLPANKLVLTDTFSGESISNPFTVGIDGYPRNADGNRVSPTITEETYAIAFDTPGGVEQWSYPDIRSDAFGLTSGSGEMVDTTFNNFPLAQATDLSAFNFIFIQSETSAWEGTATGPVNSYYSFRTGGTGPAGTGTFDLFYDSAGNEWKIAQISESASPKYLGKSFSSLSKLTKNLATAQVVAATNAVNTFQGDVYDYGSSTSAIVIPAGITRGVFRYTISPSGASLAALDTINGTIYTADMYKDGVISGDATTRLYHGGSTTTGGLDSMSAMSGVIPVVAGESWDLRAVMNGEDSSAQDPDIYFSLEFTPVFS